MENVKIEFLEQGLTLVEKPCKRSSVKEKKKEEKYYKSSERTSRFCFNDQTPSDIVISSVG